jgi:hypothetical protein
VRVNVYVRHFPGIDVGHGTALKPAAIVYEALKRQRGGKVIPID